MYFSVRLIVCTVAAYLYCCISAVYTKSTCVAMCVVTNSIENCHSRVYIRIVSTSAGETRPGGASCPKAEVLFEMG